MRKGRVTDHPIPLATPVHLHQPRWASGAESCERREFKAKVEAVVRSWGSPFRYIAWEAEGLCRGTERLRQRPEIACGPERSETETRGEGVTW